MDSSGVIAAGVMVAIATRIFWPRADRRQSLKLQWQVYAIALLIIFASIFIATLLPGECERVLAGSFSC